MYYYLVYDRAAKEAFVKDQSGDIVDVKNTIEPRDSILISSSFCSLFNSSDSGIDFGGSGKKRVFCLSTSHVPRRLLRNTGITFSKKYTSGDIIIVPQELVSPNRFISAKFYLNSIKSLSISDLIANSHNVVVDGTGVFNYLKNSQTDLIDKSTFDSLYKMAGSDRSTKQLVISQMSLYNWAATPFLYTILLDKLVLNHKQVTSEYYNFSKDLQFFLRYQNVSSMQELLMNDINISQHEFDIILQIFTEYVAREQGINKESLKISLKTNDNL